MNADQTKSNEILVNLCNNMQKLSEQTNDIAIYFKKQKEEQESEERTSLEEWQPIQTQYVSSYLEKCISRMNLHEESARYYNKRHYFVIIPATAMGVITSTAAFSQWSGNVLCGETSWVTLLIGALMALSTFLHNLSEFVFAYKDKARQHQQSYINFSRLVKRISNEYYNPTHEHKPYRQFIESISEDYDRYTEHAPVVPASIDKMLLGRWIKSNEMAKENNKNSEEDSTTKDDKLNRENRIIQQSTISTAIDAAKIHNSAVPVESNLQNNAEEEHRLKLLLYQNRNRRLSNILDQDHIAEGFKSRNPLTKLQKVDNRLPPYSTFDAGFRRQSVGSYYTNSLAPKNFRNDAYRLSEANVLPSRENRYQPFTQEPNNVDRVSFVHFDKEEEEKRFNTNSAAAFAQRSSTLQKAAAKFQSKQSSNIPFDSMIELNAISSSSTSNVSSSSPPKKTNILTNTTQINDPDADENLEKKENNADVDIVDKKRKKKKRHNREPIVDYSIQLKKAIEEPQEDELEDVTPDDVESHVLGRVTYHDISQQSAETIKSTF